MKNELMFSSASDEWETPQYIYDLLNAEFNFEVDLAATKENTKCESFYSKESNSLEQDWGGTFDRGWINPPYSRNQCAKFIDKAARQRRRGFMTVMLLPSRTDTKAFHAHVYDVSKWKPRDGVEIRFIAGRLKFSNSKNSAPFPSMIVIFRPEIG